MTINFNIILYVAALLLGVNYFVSGMELLATIAVVVIWCYIGVTSISSIILTLAISGIKSVTMKASNTTRNVSINYFAGILINTITVIALSFNGYFITACFVGFVGVWMIAIGYKFSKITKNLRG